MESFYSLFLGKQIKEWIDLKDVLDLYCIKSADELREILANSSELHRRRKRIIDETIAKLSKERESLSE